MSLFSGVFNASSSGVVYGVNWDPTTDTYKRTGIAAGDADAAYSGGFCLRASYASAFASSVSIGSGLSF